MRNTTSCRAYFFDLDTREEIGSHVCTGNGANGVRGGVQYTDTTLAVYVADPRGEAKLTAADFPGRRVAVKVWAPLRDGGRLVEWYALVSEADGFRPADGTAERRAELGQGARRLSRAA